MTIEPLALAGEINGTTRLHPGKARRKLRRSHLRRVAAQVDPSRPAVEIKANSARSSPRKEHAWQDRPKAQVRTAARMPPRAFKRTRTCVTRAPSRDWWIFSRASQAGLPLDHLRQLLPALQRGPLPVRWWIGFRFTAPQARRPVRRA